MEIYLAVLFLWLITGLIFLINAICSHTWTDLVESLILAHTLCYAVSVTILLLLSLGITVWLSFYCNWQKKWLFPVYVIFATSCLLSFPVTYNTATAYPFLYWTTY